MKTRPNPNEGPPVDLELAVVPIDAYVQQHQPPGFSHVVHSERHLSHSPGGDFARRHGCICPQIHDRRGNVALLIDGHPMMVIAKGCPFHTPLDLRERHGKGDTGVFVRGPFRVGKLAKDDKPPKEPK